MSNMKINSVADLIKTGAKTRKDGKVIIDQVTWELILTILNKVKLEVSQ